MQSLVSLAQNPDNFEALPLADLAESLLDYLKAIHPHNAHLRNLCVLDGSPITQNTYGTASRETNNDLKSRAYKDRLSALQSKLLWPLAEAWQFLERHGLIAPEPMAALGFYFVTRAGMAIKDRADFDAATGQAGESAKDKKKIGRAS